MHKPAARRRKRTELTYLQFLELSFGPGGVEGTDLSDGLGCRSSFESEADREAAWRAHGAEITAEWHDPHPDWEHKPLWGERRYGASG